MASQKCGFSTRTGDNFGRDLHFDRERERDSKDAKQATVLVSHRVTCGGGWETLTLVPLYGVVRHQRENVIRKRDQNIIVINQTNKQT